VIFSHLKSPVKTQSFLRFKTEIDTAISLYFYPFELGENRKLSLAQKLGKSYTMVNTDAQNRQQHRLEIQMSIAEILDIEVKELIISNKKDSE